MSDEVFLLLAVLRLFGHVLWVLDRSFTCGEDCVVGFRFFVGDVFIVLLRIWLLVALVLFLVYRIIKNCIVDTNLSHGFLMT